MSKLILEKLVNITTAFLLTVCGCSINSSRPRLGTLPTPPPGPRFYEPDKLGEHSYGFNPFEKNGIVYTCKAGHIDITHLRCNADDTKYHIEKTKNLLLKNKKSYTFSPGWESSKHKIEFTYPKDWKNLTENEKENIANKISLEAGPYIAYNANIWHEILTWFGTHFAGFEPEFNSAFSWEDIYSNLLGTKLAVEAVQSEHGYNKGMTLAINRKLKELDVQSKKTAIYASKKMRGKWYKGLILVDMIKRNMDIGLDGYVTPVLVPGINKCENPEPELLPVPNKNILKKYNFKMKYEITPKEWEKGKIFATLNPPKQKIIIPEKHYSEIMDFIKKQAVEKYDYKITE